MNIHARLVQPYRLASWLILFAWLINPATLHAQAAADPRPQPDFAAIDAYVAAEREALGIIHALAVTRRIWRGADYRWSDRHRLEYCPHVVGVVNAAACRPASAAAASATGGGR